MTRMVDETVPGDGSTLSTCPWCSAMYSGSPETCPSCHAALAADAATDATVPGLTAIDPAALGRRDPTPKPRNRLLSWITGAYPEDASIAGDTRALARPDDEVRREMLRLELEAEVANLQAEADAIVAESAAEGRDLGIAGLPPVAEPDADAAAVVPPPPAGDDADPSRSDQGAAPA